MLDETIVSLLEQRDTDIKDHLRTLYNLVVDNGYKEIVELGAGQSTFIFSAAVQKTGGTVLSIDKDTDALYRNGADVKDIIPEMTDVNIFWQDDLTVPPDVGSSIDFLFIDSDHSFEHVLAVLTLWAPKVCKGGSIALHDTDHDFGHALGVLPALNLYLSHYPGLYSVKHTKGCGGLSVLTKLRYQ